jgi:hypothetical protein
MNHLIPDMTEIVQRAKNGTETDIDFLMEMLTEETSLAVCKTIDFAIGLVNNQAGCSRIRYYLFSGNPVQRNYAALYFKRRGNEGILDKAITLKRIDKEQAKSQ